MLRLGFNLVTFHLKEIKQCSSEWWEGLFWPCSHFTGNVKFPFDDLNFPFKFSSGLLY